MYSNSPACDEVKVDRKKWPLAILGCDWEVIRWTPRLQEFIFTVKLWNYERADDRLCILVVYVIIVKDDFVMQQKLEEKKVTP